MRVKTRSDSARSDHYLSFFFYPFPPSFVRLVSRGSAVGRAKEDVKQPRRVYLHTRRRGNTTAFAAINVSQEIRRDQRRPAGTNFSHPDVAAKAVDLLGAAVVFQGILYEPPRSRYRGPVHHLSRLLRPIIKLLHSDFAQTGFVERRYNFFSSVSLKVPR